VTLHLGRLSTGSLVINLAPGLMCSVLSSDREKKGSTVTNHQEMVPNLFVALSPEWPMAMTQSES